MPCASGSLLDAAVLICGIWFVPAAAKPLHADRVVVLNRERTLQLLSHGKVIKSCKVALGGDQVGPKTRQGDHKTPEGAYTLDSRKAHSQFYKSIRYPSARDRTSARAQGGGAGGDLFAYGRAMATDGWARRTA